MYTDSRTQYQVHAVETAGPAQLVLMLYDGALAAIARARQAAAVEAVSRDLLKAQAIVSELQLTLDRERGGTVAVSLSSLYTFCLELLIDANVTKDLSRLGEVAGVLGELREVWEAACCAVPTPVA